MLGLGVLRRAACVRCCAAPCCAVPCCAGLHVLYCRRRQRGGGGGDVPAGLLHAGQVFKPAEELHSTVAAGAAPAAAAAQTVPPGVGTVAGVTGVAPGDWLFKTGARGPCCARCNVVRGCPFPTLQPPCLPPSVSRDAPPSSLCAPTTASAPVLHLWCKAVPARRPPSSVPLCLVRAMSTCG